MKKCCVCGESGEWYAKTIRYDKEKGRWVDADGFVCSETCGKKWSNHEFDFSVQKGRWS